MIENYDTFDAPKYGIELLRAGHFHFADTCDEILDPLCGVDSIIPYTIAHEAINHYAVSFLLKYLNRDDRFAEYLCAEYDTFTMVWCETTTGIWENKTRTPDALNIRISPNPFNSACAIQISGMSLNSAIIEVLDYRGELVWISGSVSLNCGNAKVVWQPAAEIPSGIYFIEISADKQRIREKVIFMK